jgi:hypothetical protein
MLHAKKHRAVRRSANELGLTPVTCVPMLCRISTDVHQAAGGEGQAGAGGAQCTNVSAIILYELV